MLFGIVFLWQLPHFLAIAWMYREDYARAGFPMLPVIEPDGRSTARQAVVYAAALLPVSLAPTLVGMSGAVYFAGALVLTLLFLGIVAPVRADPRRRDARRLFFSSIIYLPILWMLMIADRDLITPIASRVKFRAVPAVILHGMMHRSRRSRPPMNLSVSDLPLVNATLNAIATVLLIVGYVLHPARRIARASRRDDRRVRHVGAVPDVSYLIYHANVGSRPFPGRGPIRVVYFTILITHIVLAATIPPLAGVTLWRAFVGDSTATCAIARWTLPLWLYVSVTGVVVYLMLYQMY